MDSPLEIDWIDSMVIPGPWHNLPLLNWKTIEEGMHIKTIGYLIRETEDVYVLTQSIKPKKPGESGPAIIIPKVAIVAIRKFKKT